MEKKKFNPDIDLYDLLGVLSSSSSQEIKKAYRKKALTCHPDKNPDNPKAAELFHELANALEILTDESARAAYDRVLNAKKAAKLRHSELDAKRKKFKEDLEARERVAQDAAAAKRGYASATDEERLQAEIARLRKEGSRLVAEEMELLKEELRSEAECVNIRKKTNAVPYRLRLKWSTAKNDSDNGGYSYDNLNELLRCYGNIVALVVSPKKHGSALIEFATRESAEKALKNERGLASCPLTIAPIGWSPQFSNMNPPKPSCGSSRKPAFSCFPAATSKPTVQPSPAPIDAKAELDAGDDSDFERLVLKRLRVAHEEKKMESVINDINNL